MTTLRSIAILTLSITLLGVPAFGAEATQSTVEAVEWVTVADVSLFEGTAVTGVAVAPGGEAVIVGFDTKTTSHRAGPAGWGEGHVWWSRDGSEWRSGTLPEPEGARPREVIATPDGFLATGWVMGSEGAVIWTSTDGSEWSSPVTIPAGLGFMAFQVALSADGVYLVLDTRTGELYRSDDGTGFSPVDLPDDVLGGADLAVARR